MDTKNFVQEFLPGIKSQEVKLLVEREPNPLYNPDKLKLIAIDFVS